MSTPVTNDEAEANLVAACIGGDPARLDQLLELITPQDFYRPPLAELWSVLGDMRRHDQPIDQMRVMLELRRLQLIQKHQTLFLDLTTRSEALPSQAGYYAAFVVQAARQRELQELALRLEQRAAHPDADPDAVLDDFDAESLRLRRSRVNPDEMPPTMFDLAGRDNTKSWVIPGMVADHDRVITVAHEGHGKSLLSYQTAAAVSAGLHPFTRARIEPHQVLIIDCENDPDTVSERSDLLLANCIKLGVDPGDRLRYIERPEGLELTNPSDAAWLSRIVTHVQPKLLAIGPLYRLTEQDLAKEEPSRAVMAALDRARVRGNCALLMEAHVGNERQDGQRPFRPYGASAWRRWAGIGLSLKPASGWPLSSHIYKITDYRGRRSQRDWPEYVGWGRPGDWPWRGYTAAELEEEKLMLQASERWDYTS